MRYEWRKIAGPDQYTIETPNSATTKVSNLVAGCYKFELKVTNANNISARDTMMLTVNAPFNNNVVRGEAVARLSKFPK